MPSNTLRLIAGGICHLLLWCWLVAAHGAGMPGPPEAAEKTPQKPSESASAAVEESMPIYHLIDKDGNLVPVPGAWKLQDFEDLWKLKVRLERADQQPRYSIQRMSVTGTADGKRAELTIQFWVLTREDDWVRVPLRLDRAVLREPAEYKGSGEGFVRLEENGEGHVGWIRGKPDGQHQLTLKMLVPLASVGDETRLKLFAPRSTVSELKVTVPVAKAVGKVSEGAVLEPPSETNNGATEFTVRGLGGDFELTWRKAGGPVAEVPTVLEAVGAVLARIDRHSVDIEATLSVRSYGAPFDRFRVHLPKGAELVPGSPSGYTLTTLEEAEQAVPDQAVVEVRLAKKTSGPIEVRLATRRAAKPDEPFELAGFKVLGAAREWGHIAVAAVSDWQVLWDSSDGIRRIEVDNLPVPLRHEDVIAGFDYFEQPCSLTTRLVTRKTRISVEPEYLLLVDADQVRLEARLKYTVRGAKAFELEVSMPGWEFDDVEPENLVDIDGVKMSNSNVVSIPLLQPSTGQIELLVRAHRPIPEGAGSLELPLPQPQVSSPGPAAVVLAPADNVELNPDNELMAALGLVRQQVDPQTQPPDRQRERMLFYRGEAAKVAFGHRTRSQYLTADVSTQVNLEKQAGSVEQRLVYTIEYERVYHLTVELPRSLISSEQLEFEHDGQAVSVQLPGNADLEDAAGPVRVRVPLVEGCIGTCELVVRYPLRFPKLVPRKSVPLSIPLVMPAEGEGEVLSNKLSVTAAPGIKAEPGQDSWTVSPPGAPSPGAPPPGAPPPEQRRGLQLTADGPAEQVELMVGLEDADEKGEGATVVERAWVQTWLTRSLRQDRAVFSLTTARKELQLVLPAEAALDQMQVLLDGQPVEVPDHGNPVILLPNDPGRRRHLLELQYHSSQRQPPGRLSIEIPRLGGDVWVRRMYWQLILPRNEHVVATPKGFTGEFTWGWNGYFFGRKPLLQQSQLEAWVRKPLWGQSQSETWVGDSNSGRSNPDRTNCYLFSTFGKVECGELRTASRAWIVLIASGAALVAGLLLMYVPASRHPGTLFAAGVLLLGVGMLYPEPTLLVSQAACLGLALTLLAGLLQRSVARRRRGPTVLEPSSAVLEKGSTQTQYEPPVAGDQNSTQAASAVGQPPSPDANT